MQSNNSSSDVSLKCFITPVWPVSELHEKLVVASLGMLCPLTVTSNCLLIFALWKTNQLNSYSNKLIIVMSSCDLTMSLIFQSALVLIFFMKKHLTTCSLPSTINVLIVFLSQTSSFLLFLISIDRYLHIMKPHRYDVYMNGTRKKASIALCFLLAALLICIIILHRSFVTRALINAMSIVLLWLVVILYSSILRKLQRHFNNRNETRARAGENANTTSTQSETHPPGFNLRSHLSVIKTLRVLQVTMLVLYAPFLAVAMPWNYYLLHLRVFPGHKLIEAFNWSHLIVECNAWVNAWILIHGNSKCRRLLLSIIRNSARGFWNGNSVAAETVGGDREQKIEETTP